jgi:N-acetylglutamate synthase-like GNAT family acetyltransferase
MSTEKNIPSQIQEILKSFPLGLQTEEIATKLGLTRHTVSKYLEVLLAGGSVHFNKVGRSRLWKDLSTSVSTRILSMEDLEDIIRIVEKIEKGHGQTDSKRMDYLKETATYHIEQGNPLMNLGAEIDGKLVGFVFSEARLWEFGLAEKSGWIKVLGIDPDYQGKGIGKKLGETLLMHFKRNKIRKVRTLVNWYDGELISYFKSMGFDILNMIPLEKELEEGDKV